MDKEILKDPIYNRFYQALRHFLDTDWLNKQTTLGDEAGISRSYMSEVSKADKKLKFDKREKLSQKCGYNYLDFLQFGKELIDKSKQTSPPEKKSKIDIESKIKGAGKMDETIKELVESYKVQISYLKTEKEQLTMKNDKLYEDNIKLAKESAEENRAKRKLESRQTQSPEDQNTVVNG